VPDDKGSSDRRETMNEGIEIRVEPDETAALPAASDVLIESQPSQRPAFSPFAF